MHPRDMNQAELAQHVQNLTGMLWNLRDFLRAVISGDERWQEIAFICAQNLVFEIVYDEDLPLDILDHSGIDHYDLPSFADREREELEELANNISWLALDLMQHIEFTIQYLREDLVPAAYRRALELAEELADYPIADVRNLPITPGITAFGEGGLQAWSS